MGSPALSVLIPADAIKDRIRQLGAEITAAYPDGPIYLIGILKGACMFLADLARAIDRPVRIDFIGISSYGKGKTSSGEVRLTKDLDISIEGADILVVEDIVDSGVTLNYLVQVLKARRPRSIHIAALLDKPERRMRPVEVSYVGFRIADEFVVGYGLDFAEDYRNLRDICILKSWGSSRLRLGENSDREGGDSQNYLATSSLIPASTSYENRLLPAALFRCMQHAQRGRCRPLRFPMLQEGSGVEFGARVPLLSSYPGTAAIRR